MNEPLNIGIIKMLCNGLPKVYARDYAVERRVSEIQELFEYSMKPKLLQN